MSNATTTPTDPRQLLQLLSSAALRAKLSELAGEQRALRVLLRAAVARERGNQPKGGRNG